jgi:hypothetical protein
MKITVKNNIPSIKKFLMLCCTLILVTVMVSIALRVGTRLVLIQKLNYDNVFTQIVFFDDLRNQGRKASAEHVIEWTDKYPFEDEDDKTLSKGGMQEYKKNIENNAKRVERKIEEWATDRLVFYYMIVERWRQFERFFGWRLDNPSLGVHEMMGGYLISPTKRVDVAKDIESIKYLNQVVKGTGGRFLFVQAPYKVNKYGDDDVKARLDFSNTNADVFLEGLQESNIDTIDLRDELCYGLSDNAVHELFFFTDNHWKPATGLRAANIVAKKLNMEYGIDVDFDKLSVDKYKTIRYENFFLGSYGKKVTLAVTKPENIDILYPKFETKIHVNIPSRHINGDGGFELMMDETQLEKKDLYHLNPYGAYCYDGPAIMDIYNNRGGEEQKILLIKDSYGLTVAPFLAMGLRHLIVLEPRTFTGSIKRFIQEEKPDVVIVLYNATVFGDSINWLSHKDLFDFR